MEKTYEVADVAHAIRPGEIVIEIDEEQLEVRTKRIMDDRDSVTRGKFYNERTELLTGNRHQQFPPADSRPNDLNHVRSRIVLKREGERIMRTFPPALDHIVYIPGERIHVHIADRIGRITDGMADPENEDLYKKLISAADKMPGALGPLYPRDNYEVKFSSDAALWTWLFWMRRIADGDKDHAAGPERHKGCATEGPRRCRPIQNIEQLPTFRECIDSGKVVLDFSPDLGGPFIKGFDEDQKKNNPDYQKRAAGGVVLTPALAGITEES